MGQTLQPARLLEKKKQANWATPVLILEKVDF